MELDSYLISSCLTVVAAQRLVRLICPHCREPHTPRPDELAAVGLAAETPGSFARGRGCDRCAHSGAKGREALFEILEVTPVIAQLISRNADLHLITAAAREGGMVPFRELAQRRATEGRVSLEEVARITTEH
jgi:general secretion pathway protein E